MLLGDFFLTHPSLHQGSASAGSLFCPQCLRDSLPTPPELRLVRLTGGGRAHSPRDQLLALKEQYCMLTHWLFYLVCYPVLTPR